MPYTAHRRPPRESSEQLRARIPGWGADLDPADRPSVPRLQLGEHPTGAHWDFPDRQPELVRRERSIEHEEMPPVFGTAQPLHGVSGALRRYSYARFSEGRAAHWLLLVLADRVDAAGSHARSLLTLHPDPVASGLRAERSGAGVASRRGRSDVRHQALDPVVVAGPWLAVAAVGWLAVRSLTRR